MRHAIVAQGQQGHHDDAPVRAPYPLRREGGVLGEKSASRDREERSALSRRHPGMHVRDDDGFGVGEKYRRVFGQSVEIVLFRGDPDGRGGEISTGRCDAFDRGRVGELSVDSLFKLRKDENGTGIYRTLRGHGRRSRSPKNRRNFGFPKVGKRQHVFFALLSVHGDGNIHGKDLIHVMVDPRRFAETALLREPSRLGTPDPAEKAGEGSDHSIK
mmetsp:Transcript_5494/g.11356  ORF Transcript_5494/g.11356 Transcript_5494/m.11356 type:complete len:215 (-) Transcript_5494:26-670(-)